MGDLASLLYYKFIFKKEYDPLATAKDMGVSRDLIYKWCHGDSLPTLDRLKDLICVTGDDEIREYISRKYLGIVRSIDSVEKSELELFSVMCELVKEVGWALEDNVITREEKEKIEPIIARLFLELENLRERLRVYED